MTRLFFTVAFCSMGLMAQGVVVTVADSLKPHVLVLAPGSPQFDQALHDLIPAASLAIAGPLIPYSVIVKNISGEPLWGVQVVLWRQGVDQAAPLPYSNLVWNLDPQVPPVFAPGQARFYSPFFALTKALSQGGPVPGQGPPLPVASVASELAAERPVVATVELVVDARGNLIGPDGLHSSAKILAEEQADRSLAARLASNSNAFALQQSALQTMSTSALPPISDPFNYDFFSYQMKRQSTFLLQQSVLGQNAINDFLAVVSRRVSAQKGQ